MLDGIGARVPTLRHLWVDAGDQGTAVAGIAQTQGLTVTVVRKPRPWVRWPADQEPPPRPMGVQVLPRRWVVERTFAWLGRARRLSTDYDGLSVTEEAWIHLAMRGLMLARLAR